MAHFLRKVTMKDINSLNDLLRRRHEGLYSLQRTPDYANTLSLTFLTLIPLSVRRSESLILFKE